MSPSIETRPASPSLLDLVERDSLLRLLQQALQVRKLPQQLPPSLYDDLGIPPSQRPSFGPFGR